MRLETREYSKELVPTKYSHNIILWREHELGETRISLSARATTELIIDTSSLMFLGSENEESTERVFLCSCSSDYLHISRKCPDSFIDFDIGSSSCHVRRDGH